LCVKNINTLIEEGVKKGIHHFIVPQASSIEFIKEDIYTWKVANISEIIEIVEDKKKFSLDIQDNQKEILFKKNTLSKHSKSIDNIPKDKTGLIYLIDSIDGNETLKRALQISLAGKHNLLLIGEPGSGKSLIAKSSRELLPLVQSIDLNTIQIEKLIETRESRNIREIGDTFKAPFREPHHTSSYSEIIGNRNIPGEIVLSNKGILFLDEMSEINKRVIEGLRQPLEDKYIQINQGEKIETDFILIGSMNPCDCGFYKSKNRRCICTKTQRDRFQRKISSPLFQRFDLTINMSKIENHIYNNKSNLRGEYIFDNIIKVREIQNNRKYSYIRKVNKESTDADNLLHSRHLLLALDSLNEKSLGTKEKNLLIDITKRFYFSKREVSSLLRVARTIADIENEKQIRELHIHEALSYKNKRE
jgi:magnesium chelatase family protein